MAPQDLGHDRERRYRAAWVTIARVEVMRCAPSEAWETRLESATACLEGRGGSFGLARLRA